MLKVGGFYIAPGFQKLSSITGTPFTPGLDFTEISSSASGWSRRSVMDCLVLLPMCSLAEKDAVLVAETTTGVEIIKMSLK